MIYIFFLFVFIISHIWFYAIRRYIRGNFSKRIIRIFLINLPYLLIFLYFPLPKWSLSLNLFVIIPILLLVILFRLSDFTTFKLNMKNSFLKFQEPIDLGKLISRLSEVTLIPIIEELFYRGTIPLDTNNTYFFIAFSVLMFNISHYIGGLKSINQHIRLILFSICSTVIYIYTNNLIYSILFHILFNSPWFAIHLKNYIFHKKRRTTC